MFNLFNSISHFFRDFEGCDSIGISAGNQRIEDVIKTAESIAEEKKWFSHSKTRVKPEVYLMQYEFSKKKVWFVYFTHVFSQQDRTNFEFENEYTSMRFAVVRIDNVTGEVLFADFIKPQIT